MFMVSTANSVCLAGGGTLKIWQQFLSCLFRFTFWIRRRIWRWRSWGFSFSFRLFLCILFWLLLLDCFFGRFWSRRFWTWARSTFLFNNSRMHIKIPDNSCRRLPFLGRWNMFWRFRWFWISWSRSTITNRFGFPKNKFWNFYFSKKIIAGRRFFVIIGACEIRIEILF